MAESGAPGVGGQAVSLLGPTLVIHGTDEQKAEHLPRILSGDVAWAQGYSEPGVGSDLAGLQTRAVRDGDDYVVNGQKIWTSGARYADWIFALTRTDPDAPKHRGISFLMMPLDTPGITVRPFADATWREPFYETFFEDARVSARGLLGEENRGWYVAVTLLDYERSGISGAISHRRSIRSLIAYLESDEAADVSQLGRKPTLRTEIADRWIESEVLFNFAFRLVSEQARGVLPNYEGLDEQALRLIALAGRRADRHEELRALRDAVGRQRRPRAAAGQLHAQLRLLDPGDDRRRQQRDPAEHHRDARPRLAPRLAAGQPSG